MKQNIFKNETEFECGEHGNWNAKEVDSKKNMRDDVRKLERDTKIMRNPEMKV